MKHEWKETPAVRGQRVKGNYQYLFQKSIVPKQRICIHCGAQQVWIGSHWEPPAGKCEKSTTPS